MVNTDPFRKLDTLNPDAAIGRHGAKYRVSSNGKSRPTPRPASVKVSRMPCDATADDNSKQRSRNCLENGRTERKNNNVDPRPARPAKTNECEKPRWPNMLPYEIPNLNPTTSMSGRAARTARIIPSFIFETCAGAHAAREEPTSTWAMTVGNVQFSSAATGHLTPT